MSYLKIGKIFICLVFLSFISVWLLSKYTTLETGQWFQIPYSTELLETEDYLTEGKTSEVFQIPESGFSILIPEPNKVGPTHSLYISENKKTRSIFSERGGRPIYKMVTTNTPKDISLMYGHRHVCELSNEACPEWVNAYRLQVSWRSHDLMCGLGARRYKSDNVGHEDSLDLRVLYSFINNKTLEVETFRGVRKDVLLEKEGLSMNVYHGCAAMLIDGKPHNLFIMYQDADSGRMDRVLQNISFE